MPELSGVRFALRNTADSLAARLGQAACAVDQAARLIEEIRRALPPQEEETGSSRLVEGPACSSEKEGPIRSFRWESDTAGSITRVEGAPRAPLLGHRIGDASVIGKAMRCSFHGLPFHIAGDGALAGEWHLDGAPLFDASSGRLIGLHGIARRPGANPSRLTEAVISSDMMRQFAHEIRTPLNAILGFAEMIEGEHLGPAEAAYRQRAAEIVREAARVMERVKALDRGGGASA